MEVHLIMILSCLLKLSLQLRSENNKCDKNKCCSGYYMYGENETCLACIGGLGENCSRPCSTGYYGRLCKSKCMCPDNQCDKVIGCAKDNGRTLKPTSIDTILNFIRRHWSIIPIAVLLVLFAIICTLLVSITKKRDRIKRSIGSRRRTTDYTHSLPLDPPSDYQHMISRTPKLSIEYINASTEYINASAEYINASTECLNTSFQIKPVDDISGSGYI